MLNRRLIACIILLAPLCALSQENTRYPQVTIASPQAASLGKYMDIPVNHHTGIPPVNLPLYTIQEGPLSLPISLSYHAGGIKVMEPASWVGAGWALQAGGMISRVVRGAPDEAGTTAMGQYGHFSHYGFSNFLTVNSGSTAPNDQAFARGEFDGEPDLFSFSFNGYNGKFYFDDDRKPMLVNGEDLKIAYWFPRDTASTWTAQTANIQGFIITVPSGDKYHFGITPGGNPNGARAIEMSFPYSGDPNTTDRLYSSWFLTRVISADGMFAINLTYAQENYSYYTLSMSPVNGHFVPSWTNPAQNEYKLVKNYIEGVRLSQLSFSNGTVILEPGSTRTDLGNTLYAGVSYLDHPNTEAKTLQAITITNNQGFCKKYRLYHSYFTAPAEALPGYLSNYSILTDKYRLKLDSLQEMACDNSLAIPPHKFVYYTNSLPRRLSFGQDHWGYSNGITNNNTLVATYTIAPGTTVAGANREANWPAMQSGALIKIMYPTGGYTAYEFEPHRTWTSVYKDLEVYRFGCSVGFSGSLEANYPNLAFSNNAYRLVLVNGPCPPNAYCPAAITLYNGSNQVVYTRGLAGNSRDTHYVQLPAGIYRAKVTRQATSLGKGAEFFFTELIPNALTQENTMIGGLRIKQLIHKDSLLGNDSIKTRYDYTFNNQSTGTLYSRPAYVQLVRNDIVKMFGMAPYTNHSGTHLNNNGCMAPETGSNQQPYLKSASPIFPMATTQGNHIGYNEVKVSQPGNGYSLYRYYGSSRWDNNYGDIAYRKVNLNSCDLATPISPAAPLPYEYRRGQLKYEGHFTEPGQLLKESHYTMEYDSTRGTPAYMVSYVLGYVLGNTYELRGFRKKQMQVITYAYAPSTGLTSRVIQASYQESPWHNQPTRQVTILATGDTQTIRTKYTTDFRMPACDTISSGLTGYDNACNSCNTAMTASLSTCTTIVCRYAAWVSNIVCRANARKAFILKRRNSFTNPTNAFAGCLLNARNAANASLRPILDMQQQDMLAPIESTVWKNSLLQSAALHIYDYMSYPAGKVYLAQGKKIHLATPSSVFTPAGTTANNTALLTDTRYEWDVTFQYHAGNLVQATYRDGLSKAFIWGYNQAWPVAQVSNATTDRVAYTSFETADHGGWSLSSGALVTTNGGITGKNSLAGSISRSMPMGNYVVCLWGTANTRVNGQLQTQPVKTIGNWKYYEVKLNNSSSVSVSGDRIDEVRLFPVGAQMTTYTYEPLAGINSQCDPANRIQYYEYDPLGRLKQVRDQHRYIIRKIDYQYKQPVIQP